MRHHKLQKPMKKILLLLALLGAIFTACQGGLDNEENGGNPSIPKIELSQQTIEVDFEPDTYTVSVTSPYSWDATSKNDWIVVESKTGIAGTKQLSFRVERNEEEKVREGTIVLSNSTFNLATELYVIQKAFEPKISLGVENLNFIAECGTQEIAITAYFEYEVNTSAEWLTCTKNENGITVIVPNYVEIEERTAEITISNEKYNISKVVKVTQGAFEPKLSVEPSELNFAVEGGSQEITITANFEYKVSTTADWISYTETDNVITITASNHIEIGKSRTANVTISSEKYNISKVVKVTQNGLSEDEYYAKCCIIYTSSDGEVVTPYRIKAFGANIVSNTYENRKGVIKFDAPITSIGDDAFYYSSSLTSVTIGNSVTSIGGFAFSGCTSLTSITIPDSVTSIGTDAFYLCSSLTSVAIPASVTSIGEYAFFNCTSLTTITIPDSVTSIGEYAFYDCSSLTSVTIPNSVTSIGNSAFSNCSNLTAFYGKFASADNRCLVIDGMLNSFAPAGLTEYTIPNSVTSIGSEAFAYCSSLTSVTIPDSVTSIGTCAFYDCSSSTSVYCKATTPPAGGSNMFGYDASGLKIYVPTASVDAYKSAEYWKDYAWYIVGYDF